MIYEPTDYENMGCIASHDVEVLRAKGRTYGDSWRKRGGVGAFMMLARKWDRIEQQCSAENYDVFEASCKSSEVDGLLDDIADLRRYLLLVEDHVQQHFPCAPTAGYVNQD